MDEVRKRERAAVGGGGRFVLKVLWRVVLGYCVLVTVVRVGMAWPRMHSVGDFALFLAGMCEDSTVYAPGYSEERFWEVRPGMSRNEVEGVLGQPLWRWEGGAGREIWSYSGVRCGEGGTTCNDGFFWKRMVVFDAAGKVLELDGQYWDD